MVGKGARKEGVTLKDTTSRRVRSIPPSGIRRFFDIVATMDDVISLGLGEPDFVTPPNILQAGIHSLEEGRTGYTSNAGMLELRQAIAEHLGHLYGVRYHPEDEILVTVGTSEGLHAALLALVDPGDEVIMPEPCFVSYRPGIVLVGGVAVGVPTQVENDFQVSAADIEPHITPRTKVLLLGYPNNPTGAVMSKDKLLGIAELAERHDLLVISDELYGRLVYGMEHTCFSSLEGMRERTILVQGFSKSYAMTGWRLGYLAGTEEVVSAVRKVHQYIIMSAPTTAQYAALEALARGEEHVQRMVREYDARRRVIVAGLNEIGMPCFEPKGAFYAFPSIQNTKMSSEEFSERLLEEERVAVVPGRAFGECGEGYVRCSYTASMTDIEEALGRMQRFVRRHRR